MGNTYSATTQRTLSTAAMAKYMDLTKPQLMRLRDTVLPYCKATQGMIQRSYIEYGLSKSVEPTNNANNNNNASSTTENDDAKIFGHLFTMCDIGNGQVDCLEFIVGVSILACKNDSFEAALRFALRVLDVTGVGEVDSRNAFKLLKGEWGRFAYLLLLPLLLLLLFGMLTDNALIAASHMHRDLHGGILLWRSRTVQSTTVQVGRLHFRRRDDGFGRT
jgi:Ca2+-binding EF-hand superfamily protein